MALEFLAWASREAVETFSKMEKHGGQMTLGGKEKRGSKWR